MAAPHPVRSPCFFCGPSSATASRPDRVKPPAFTTDDVDERMRECLRVIARELAPDSKRLEGKVRQSDPSSSVKKRGISIMPSRWDKGPQYALACLAVGENVEAANECISRWCRDYPISKDNPQDAGDVDPRKILRAALLPETRARLTAESLATIEEASYAFVFKRRVIDPAAPPWNNASRSVWFLSGSENHDSVQKMANLLALQYLCASGNRHNGDTPLADGRPVRKHTTRRGSPTGRNTPASARVKASLPRSPSPVPTAAQPSAPILIYTT